MTDIVERLRDGEDGLEYAAADEIERLRKAVATARREALEEAAKVALRLEVPEDTGPIDGHARVMASVQIAHNIRALLEDGR